MTIQNQNQKGFIYPEVTGLHSTQMDSSLSLYEALGLNQLINLIPETGNKRHCFSHQESPKIQHVGLIRLTGNTAEALIAPIKHSFTEKSQQDACLHVSFQNLRRLCAKNAASHSDMIRSALGLFNCFDL